MLATVLTEAMLAGLARELFDDDLADLTRTLPRSSGFYLLFLLSYFTLPAVAFLILRRLWRDLLAAFGALTRKRVANDLLVGITGDLYFYAWVRARLNIMAAPSAR